MRKGYILEEYVILKCCAEAKADLGLFTGRIVVRLSLAAVAAGIRTKAQHSADCRSMLVEPVIGLLMLGD